MEVIVPIVVLIGLVFLMFFIRKKLIESFKFNKTVVFLTVFVSLIVAIVGLVVSKQGGEEAWAPFAAIIVVLHTYAIRTNRIFGWDNYGEADVENWDGTVEVTFNEGENKGTARPVYNTVGAGTVIIALIISALFDVVGAYYLSKALWFIIPAYLIISNIIKIKQRKSMR